MESRQGESEAVPYQSPAGAILLSHPVIRGLSDLARTAWCRIYRRAAPYEGCRVIMQPELNRAIGVMHLTPGHALTDNVIGELVEAALLIQRDEVSWLVHDGASSEDALLFASLLAQAG